MKQLRCLLLEGGGNDTQYEVPLANGCEILISSTPFSILRMLGHSRTNFERLKYLVFDEANILVEKFPRQIKTLISHYHNLLKINDRQQVAQFILITNYWSNKLNVFLDSYMMARVIVTTNKLEASYFGRTQHIINECDEIIRPKADYLHRILRKVSYNDEPSQNKNTVIFTNKHESVIEIGKVLINMHDYANVNLVHRGISAINIQQIENKWNSFDSDSQQSHATRTYKNRNLILIIEQHSINHININNAKCVIHYDFPASKKALADRLWFMRKYFAVPKSILCPSKDESFCSSQIDINEVESDACKEKLNVKLEGKTELVQDDKDRILSYILLTKRDKDYSEGFLNYLRRIGFDEKNIPKVLIEMASKRAAKKEQDKIEYPLCPYVKSYGECLHINRTSCLYRHKPNQASEAIRLLDEDFYMPSEGYIKVYKERNIEISFIIIIKPILCYHRT